MCVLRRTQVSPAQITVTDLILQTTSQGVRGAHHNGRHLRPQPTHPPRPRCPLADLPTAVSLAMS